MRRPAVHQGVLPTHLPDEAERVRERFARRKQAHKGYSYFHPGKLFIVQGRERKFLEVLKKLGLDRLDDKVILEVGCGSGGLLRGFLDWDARPENLYGVDLLADRVWEAKARSPHLHILQGNAEHLPFPDRRFDLVLQSTVFTSVLDGDAKRQIAHEMRRVLRDDGVMLWYDFRYDNPQNPDVRGIGRREIAGLFPGCALEFHTLTLAPFLARAVAPRSWALCQLLEAIPLLRTHYLVAMRKAPS
jgi:ubiquinone/menaquinone biosynthesis C-methylase UbiE